MKVRRRKPSILYALDRAGLSIFGALGKFDSSGPPRAIYVEAIVHYSTIHKQHISTELCMYANTVLTLLAKSIVSYCYLSIIIVVSAGLSMCYHIITMKVCLEL